MINQNDGGSISSRRRSAGSINVPRTGLPAFDRDDLFSAENAGPPGCKPKSLIARLRLSR
jgi:hypothetical protein